MMRGSGRGLAGVFVVWQAAAMAAPIETGSPDLTLRWDQTVRYTAGWRVQGRDATLADTWALQAGEYRFDRGDMVTNRLDLLSEFELHWQRRFGARLSAAGWYDAAYDDEVRGNPAYAGLAPLGLDTAYGANGGRLTSTTRRYYTHSAEWMDANVFGHLDLGEVPVDLKLGRQNIYWGESLLSPIHGVAYSQGPVDFRKAVANPGAGAKELFLPLNRLVMQLQPTQSLSVAGEYSLEWKPYRIYEGGTYFTYADPFFQGGTSYLGTPYLGDLASGPDAIPRSRGSGGLALRWTAPGGATTLGLYARRFDDKVMSVVGRYDPAAASAANPTGLADLHNAYATGVRLYGLSLATSVNGVAIGAELVRREHGVLNTLFGAPGLARGSSWHALANAIVYVGKTPLFDAAVLTGELQYSRLGNVEATTAANFWHVDHACPLDPVLAPSGGSADNGCSTDSAWGLNLLFEPTWYQVRPGLDLSLPMAYARGLKGNSPVPFGGNSGGGSWSLGLKGDLRSAYTFTLAYNGYFGHYDSGANPLNFSALPGAGSFPSRVMASSNGGNALLRDRGWLSLTFTTTF